MSLPYQVGHGHNPSVFQGSSPSPLPPWSPLGCLSLPSLHLELIPGCWPWSPPAVHLLGSSLQKGGRAQHPGRAFLCTVSRRMPLEALSLRARQNAAVHRGSASDGAIPGQLPGKCPPSPGRGPIRGLLPCTLCLWVPTTAVVTVRKRSAL